MKVSRHISRFRVSMLPRARLSSTAKRERHTNMNYKENAALVKKYLDDNDWHYEENDHGNVVTYHGGIGGFSEKGGLYDSYKFILFVSEDAVQSYASMPAPAKTKLAEIAEFVTRANHGLKFGKFELDYNDGEVRFHISFPSCVLQNDLDDSLAFILGGGVSMLHRYARGYMKVVMGDITPEAAIKEIES